MVLSSVGVVHTLLACSAIVWWFVAPRMAFVGDPRLPDRNPDHARRVVRFYRAWGLIAIGVGAVLAYAV